MKLATWNVNSIRARLPLLLEWLDEARPDVALLQETKVTPEMFPREPLDERGYNYVMTGEAGGRNGVAILARRPIDLVTDRLPGDPEDAESRYIEAFVDGLRVASVYVPNGTAVGTARFAYKLAFYDRLRAHAKDLLEADEPFVIGGDFNVAPFSIDVFDHVKLDGTVCYHPDERAKFRALLHQGLYDAFRVCAPDQAHAYSWWDYQGRSWRANEGLRIDHLLLSPDAADRLGSCTMERDLRGRKPPSDHVPVCCELEESGSA